MMTPLSSRQIDQLEDTLAERANRITGDVPPFVPARPGPTSIQSTDRAERQKAPQGSSLFRAAAALLVVILGVALLAINGTRTDTADLPPANANDDAAIQEVRLDDFVVWIDPVAARNGLPRPFMQVPDREFLGLRASVTIEEYDAYWADFPDVLDYRSPQFIYEVSPRAWRIRDADKVSQIDGDGNRLDTPLFASIDEVLAIDGVVRVENVHSCDDPTSTILSCDLDLDDPGFLVHEWLFFLPFVVALLIAAKSYRGGFDREAKAIAVLAIPIAFGGWVLSILGDALAAGAAIVAEADSQHGAEISLDDWFGMQTQSYTTGGVASPIANVDPILADQLDSVTGLWLIYVAALAMASIVIAAIMVVVGATGTAVANRSATAAAASALRWSTAGLVLALILPAVWLAVTTEPDLISKLTNYLE